MIQSEIGAPASRQTATTSFPVSITQVPGTYTSGTPTPGGGFLGGLKFPEIRLFGINIFPLLVLLLVGLVIGGFLYFKSRESLPSAIPTTDAIEQAAAAYQEAREQGDLQAAKRHALDAATLLVIQAEAVPRYSNAYLEKAEIWKEIARTIEDQPSGPIPDVPRSPGGGVRGRGPGGSSEWRTHGHRRGPACRDGCRAGSLRRSPPDRARDRPRGARGQAGRDRVPGRRRGRRARGTRPSSS